MQVVITGASRGLGKAMAASFAAAGDDLWLSSRNDHALYQALEELRERHPGPLIRARAFDLATAAGAKGLAEWVLGSGQVPDVLINNAGQFLPGRLHDEPEGTLEQMLAVNLYSAYHLTRRIIPAMISRKKGHIINICSVASLSAYDNGGSYSISKFALAGFSRNLREEMKPHGIRVTTVYPGAAYTDSWASSGIARDRFMEAADIATMVLAATRLSAQACAEEIILRPQEGDI